MMGKKSEILIILCVLCIPIFLAPHYTQSSSNSVMQDNNILAESNWLSGWNYRKSHMIIGSEGAGPNYQIRVFVNYGHEVDSEDSVNCNNLCQSDFSDIRWTDDDGVTLLDFWMESFIDSVYGIFWIEVKDNLDYNQTIYLYFGSDSEISTSNGDSTFIFFDDFEDQDFNEWNLSDGDSWEIVSDVVTQKTHAAYCDGAAINRTLRADLEDLDYGIMVHLFAMVVSSGTSAGYSLWGTGISDDENHIGFYSGSLRLNYIAYYRNFTYYAWPYNNSYTNNTWHELDFGMNPNTDKRRAWKDGEYMGEVDLIDSSGLNTFCSFDQIRVSAGTHSGQNMWIDDYYIRKWIESEPQNGIWGEMESEDVTTSIQSISTTQETTIITTTANATTIDNTSDTKSTTDSSSPVEIWSIISYTITIGSTVVIIVLIVLIIRNRP